jgi:hypothetical protein
MAARQPQFYKKVVPLTSEQHAQLHIDATDGYAFSRDATAVLLTTVEFSRASREYPIVFLAEGENVNPVALLGMPGSENQFVSEDGKWDAAYIPAYVRRYPFIPGTGVTEKELVLCIDEDAPSINTEHGVPLFEDGEHSPFLKRAIGLVDDYQLQVERTGEFSARLKKLKILVPMKADVKMGGETSSLTGFMVVDTPRLKALRPKQLAELVKNDDMALIYAHLSSIGNFNRLAPRKPAAAPEMAS